VNLEVAAVSEPGRPPERDFTDVAVLTLISAGFLASWMYVFMHPGDTAYVACVGGTGAWGCVFHWLTIRDQKVPDAQ
jgi:hypothetical protein